MLQRLEDDGKLGYAEACLAAHHMPAVSIAVRSESGPDSALVVTIISAALIRKGEIINRRIRGKRRMGWSNVQSNQFQAQTEALVVFTYYR